MEGFEAFEIRFQEAKTQEEKVNIVKEFLEDQTVSQTDKAAFVAYMIDNAGMYKRVKIFKPVFSNF